MDLRIFNSFFAGFPFEHLCGEGSHVDRCLHLLQKLNQGTHDIIVSVRHEDTLDAVLILGEILKIRRDDFDAQLFIRSRIANSAFDHKNIVIIFNDKHVFAVFVESAKGKNTYLAHMIIPPFGKTLFLL